METTAARLKKALEMRGMRQVDLSEKTGIPKGSISQYLSGAVTPKLDKVHLMADALNVSEMWLAGLASDDLGDDYTLVNDWVSERDIRALHGYATKKNDPYMQGLCVVLSELYRLRLLILDDCAHHDNDGNRGENDDENDEGIK